MGENFSRRMWRMNDLKKLRVYINFLKNPKLEVHFCWPSLKLGILIYIKLPLGCKLWKSKKRCNFTHPIERASVLISSPVDQKLKFNNNEDESSTGAVQIMKTIKIKNKNILKSKIKDLIFNRTMVKLDIFCVKVKNKVY